MTDKMSVVNQPVKRKDARDKALGIAEYTGDMSLPGMLYGRVLRSQYPHAIVKDIDIAEAEKVPGVVCVLTAGDIPGVNHYGLAQNDEQVMAGIGDKVRYKGDAIALVAAETEAIAAEAVKKIGVDYEKLPGVFSPGEALAEDSPQVHEEGNLIQHTKLRKGDLEKGIRESHVIAENTYQTQMVEHAYLEPEASLASLDKDGNMDIWTSTQYTYRDRRQIAPVLGMGINKLRVHQTVCGGGFGGKDDITTEIDAALLALKTGRPVKVVFKREESFITTTKRHPVLVECRTGASKDGMLTFLEGKVYGDTGAYASLGMFVIKKIGIHLSGPYEIPNIKNDTYTVYTNNTPAGAMRGFGVVQSAFCHENQMDILARKLGMDPFEFRHKNALDVGKKTSTSQELKHSVGIRQTIEKVREAYEKRKQGRENG